MTEPAPLTGPDLEIAHRLTAGQHPAHIEECGRYLRAWSPADVRRVARRLALYALARREERAAEAREPRPRIREECGTTTGHARHRKRKERICDDCRQARLDYRKSLQKTPTRKPGPQPLPREHGTPRGYYQHRKIGEKACEPCADARRTSRKSA